MYGKHFASAYSGSMYGAGPVVFAVWGFAIANADRNGILEMNPRLIASTLGCDVGEVAAAIDYLCAADPHSRSKEEEGRRLVREAEYQYRMVNHSLYRAMRDEDARRDYFREKKRQSRERMRAVQSVKPVHHGQPRSTHTDTDTDTDTEFTDANASVVAGKPAPCPYEAIVNIYHEVLPELPAVAKLTEPRKALLKARWREGNNDLDDWRAFFEHVKQSDFLMGRAKGRGDAKPFQASLEWLVRPSNFVKVIEGNYNR